MKINISSVLENVPFRLAEFLIAAAFATAVFLSWRADRRDRAQLASDLAAANQSLAQAGARQHDRDAQLAQTLAALAAQKRAVTTPPQILRELQQHLPLPSPIAIPRNADTSSNAQICHFEQSEKSLFDFPGVPPSSSEGGSIGSTDRHPFTSRAPCAPEALDPTRPSPSKLSHPLPALLPLDDLKPIYDFALDCQACQARLSASQSDLADERAKTAVLTRERDAAVHAAKGGGTLRRIARAAKWFAIGAAVGALAATANH